MNPAAKSPKMSKKPEKFSQTTDLLRKYNNTEPSIARLLRTDPNRFDSFSRSACGLMLDYSRCTLDSSAMNALTALAEASGIAEQREQLFGGAHLNFTEDRSVLHPLWRSQAFDSLLAPDEASRLGECVEALGKIAGVLREGRLPGNESARIRHVVHIGIGGSLLGPRLLVDAFTQAGGKGEQVPEIHFLSSVDPGPRESLMARINPEETVVVVVSKSFTTSEVMTHAEALFQWQLGALDESEANLRRFAVTSQPHRAAQFSIAAERVLEMGEWTGGRYSLWSPVGLTAAIAMGPENFSRLLAGGAAMDAHFREAPLDENLPVIAALLDVWHRNFRGHSNLAVIPYDSRLERLPGWLQQVCMESNGKRTTVQGDGVDLDTSQVIFGDTGTDAQHSFFQALHQGTTVVPVDFIGVTRAGHADAQASARLFSHMLAQATAMARGRSLEEVREAMRAEGCPEDEISGLAAHRVMPGERPSNVILLDDCSPETIGALLVFYEHRVFVQSVIWGINAFDQWGVELGKTLAGAIEPAVTREGELPEELSELRGLLEYLDTNA